jgi:hypothetical protein
MREAIAHEPPSIPRLLPLRTVAELLCISPHTVRAFVKRGKLHPVKICRRLLFHPSEIARFIAECQ